MNDWIKERIQRSIPGAFVTVLNPRKDNRHFEASVVSDQFEGLSLLEQHKMVMDCLKDSFHSEKLHALRLKTSTQL